MSKAIKNKKDKVPKITEEEYARYISSLKASCGVTREGVENAPLVESQCGVRQSNEHNT